MPVRDLVLILVVCFAWAFNFIAIARGMQQFSPFVFTVLRFAILLTLLLPFLKLPPRDQWWRLVLVCLSIGALHFSTLFWALGVSEDVSSIAITQQTYVPMTVILAMLILGERVGWRSLAAIAVSFSGVLLLSFDPLMLTQWNVLGIALLSALFQAVGSVYMRGIRGIGVFSFQAWTAAISLPVLLLATLLFDTGQVRTVATAGWLDWGSVLYSTLIASIVGHGLFFFLVQRHPVSAIMPYMLLTPVLAVVFGVLVWGDRPGWRLLAGGALVLAGILAITLRALRRATESRAAANRAG
jgi:O-acetylserine/cysteine efflux transporter